jgi:hypothetical protein
MICGNAGHMSENENLFVICNCYLLFTIRYLLSPEKLLFVGLQII